MLLNTADKVYAGSLLADAVYLGDTKVWPPAPTGPFPIERPWVSNGYNGIFRALGELLAADVGLGATFYNPAREAAAGTLNAAPNIPADSYTVSVAQATNLDSYRLAFRALDGGNTSNGNAATGGEAHTTSMLNPWWRVDFGAGRGIIPTRLGIRNASSANASQGQPYMWQGSNNGTDWVDVAAVTVTATAGNWYTVAAPANTGPYRFLRILNTKGTAGYANLGEVEVWGTLT